MKRINGLADAPAALAQFVVDPTTPNTWPAFGNYQAGAGRRELTAALVEQQHGLCAYCEITLVSDDTRVEHFVPQSDPVSGAALAVDHRNLMAVCMGGSNASFGPVALNPDPTRYLDPVKANMSCDAAKGNTPATMFLDPRSVPAFPSLFSVNEDGVLSADPASCAAQSVDVTSVEKHILGLRLNVGRLRNQREAVRAALTQTYQIFSELQQPTFQQQLIAFAESQLLPDGSNRLSPFFTTTRSFFGPVAEQILEQPPHAWI
jgi:uncharacterized protein (TIGR02646 family)